MDVLGQVIAVTVLTASTLDNAASGVALLDHVVESAGGKRAAHPTSVTRCVIDGSCPSSPANQLPRMARNPILV
ncbi:hypothetical protein [Streptomyces sp. NPDC060031]|uniref:hypothetical protein n=1 Tax=Streptomyces sp. NPDC060031 TaxID=3347043 RepID=UPI0036CB7BF3